MDEKWQRVETNIWRRGERLYIRFRQDGKRYTFPVKSGKIQDARALMKKKQGMVVEGRDDEIRPKNYTFDELAADWWTAQENKEMTPGALSQLRYSFDRALKFFKGENVKAIDGPAIQDYFKQRRGQITQYGKPPSSSTLRRDLFVLRAILCMGYENSKIRKLPKFPKTPKRSKRKDFLTEEQFTALMAVLREKYPYLCPLEQLAYTTGMRRSECLKLAWPGHNPKDCHGYLDLAEGTVRLHRTKNGEARVLFLDPELQEVFEEQRAKVELIAPSFPFVFFREKRGTLVPIKDFYCAWQKSLEKIGLSASDHKFHGNRRSTARNLTRAGVGRTIAKAITGHKDDATFEDYDVTAEADIREAMTVRLPAHKEGNRPASDPESD